MTSNQSMCEYYQSLNVISPDPDFKKKNIIALAALVYGIPSILIYLRIIVFLLSKKGRKEFDSSFFVLYSINGLVVRIRFFIYIFQEIFHWLFYYYVMRASGSPYLNSLYQFLPETSPRTRSGFYPTFTYFFVSYLGFLLHINIIAMTLNRFTAIVFPMKFRHIWRRIMPIIIVLVFLWPLPFSWQFWVNSPILCTFSGNNGIVYFSFYGGDLGAHYGVSKQQGVAHPSAWRPTIFLARSKH